jgi:catechol 2,3-dioxygenase-like lactoylglutathione lyase family enzyme
MAEVDERPPVWVGHISLETDRLDDSSAFMQKLGMRPIRRTRSSRRRPAST